MPRVYATSDLHGQLPPHVPDCDILLIVGDVCPDFIREKYGQYVRVDNGEQRQRHWLDTVFRPWLEALDDRGICVIGIAGNHDFVFEKSFLVPEDLPWIYLKDSEVTVNGLRIYGTPWVPNLPRWAFHASTTGLMARAEAIPEGLDILMTHGPPLNYGDVVGPRHGGPMHVGDTALLRELDRINPNLVLCGHIHEASGEYVHHGKGTSVPILNVSYLDDDYRPTLPPVALSQFLTEEDYT